LANLYTIYADHKNNLNTNKLTNKQKSYTIDEVVKATKDVDPDIW